MALINEVKRRADLALAAHCDVVMRLANRQQNADDQRASDEHESAKKKTIESVEVGRHRMGEDVLYTAANWFC